MKESELKKAMVFYGSKGGKATAKKHKDKLAGWGAEGAKKREENKAKRLKESEEKVVHISP